MRFELKSERERERNWITGASPLAFDVDLGVTSRGAITG